MPNWLAQIGTAIWNLIKPLLEKAGILAAGMYIEKQKNKNEELEKKNEQMEKVLDKQNDPPMSESDIFDWLRKNGK